MFAFAVLLAFILSFNEVFCDENINQTEFTIEGIVSIQRDLVIRPNWQADTRIIIDYGRYIGLIRGDGSFVVDGVPSGSYILEVNCIGYVFESVRVDITSKGKIRARRLNLLQPNAVMTIPYPLHLQSRKPAKYFRVREEWRMTEVLMNPMVIMLLVAFFLMVVTPKLTAQDPQMQKELANMQLPKMEMPEISDYMAKLFGGGSSKKNEEINKQRKYKENK